MKMESPLCVWDVCGGVCVCVCVCVGGGGYISLTASSGVYIATQQLPFNSHMNRVELYSKDDSIPQS